MGISGTTSTRDHEVAPGSAIDGLVDELLACYIDWRHDAATVRDAYREWSAESGAQSPLRFAAYMAALDQEQASAERYALLLGKVERAAESETCPSHPPAARGSGSSDLPSAA
jgi:hypothetical protein